VSQSVRANALHTLYYIHQQGTHDSHSSQALSLQDRRQASRVPTAPYHVLPQVWQVYDCQGHGEADGAYGARGM
jgi:hypothetical protein